MKLLDEPMKIIDASRFAELAAHQILFRAVIGRLSMADPRSWSLNTHLYGTRTIGSRPDKVTGDASQYEVYEILYNVEHASGRDLRVTHPVRIRFRTIGEVIDGWGNQGLPFRHWLRPTLEFACMKVPAGFVEVYADCFLLMMTYQDLVSKVLAACQGEVGGQIDVDRLKRRLEAFMRSKTDRYSKMFLTGLTW
jgi:hypothetical protein